MKASRPGKAFTLIELLVVVAIIGLLISILLPALANAREQAKRLVCLANLGSIGKSLYQYANEDKIESAIPIHMNMVGFNQNGEATGNQIPYWMWRTVNWFAWGGMSGDIPFRYSTLGSWMLDAPHPDGAAAPVGATWRPEYAAIHRPLSFYITGGNISEGDRKKLDWFRCPSDTGYPDDARIDDAPSYNTTRPLYRSVGNSYRASLASLTPAGQGQAPYNGAFSVGLWGMRLSTIPDTSRVVWVGEPTWFNMIGKDLSEPGIQPEVAVYGWHKRKLTDNLLFADGSARPTLAEHKTTWDPETLQKMNANELLARYGTVRLDPYPAGGAFIWNRDWFNNSLQSSFDTSKWPFANYQDNLSVPTP